MRVSRPTASALLLLSAVLGLSAIVARSQGAYRDEPATLPPAQPAAIPPATAPPAPPPQFMTCTLCHGRDARGTALAPTLIGSPHIPTMSDTDISDLIHKGRNKMPGFPIPPADTAILIKYLRAIDPGGPASQPGGPPSQPSAAAAPAPPPSGPSPISQPQASSDAPRPFLQTCSLCHGNDARGTDRAPTLINPEHFRTLSDADLSGIVQKGKGRMPALPLPPDDLRVVVSYMRGLNTTTSATAVAGDPKAGEALFFGAGQCSSCHMARGRGSALGPDLSNVARKLRLADMQRALTDPSASITAGYTSASVAMNDGSTLQGFLRAQGSHDVVLETLDGKLHPLLDSNYRTVTPDKRAAMPAYQGTPDQQRDLLAYLSTLNGVAVGAVKGPQAAVSPAEIEQVNHPAKGEWPNYNGGLGGNRHSPLDQINAQTVARLAPRWTYTMTYAGLETTPVVVDGIMYVTGNNTVDAISAVSGRQIWHYERPKSPGNTISGDAAIGSNRGAAVQGDRVFYLTDNAHLLALNRLNGALLWEIDTPDGATGLFGGTAAPLVVGDLVITGVSGGDNGIRGFVAAYKAATGELAWKFMTIPKPGDTGPIADTWKGPSLELGGGATWTTGSADPDAGIVYWPVGNPHPDTDGDGRAGSNLYTDSDLALDLKTGKLLWYFQFTPHDLHDWDANEPVVLVNDKWGGQDRKLLLHANRNGFLYVLDRTTGKPLLASKMVDSLTWSSGVNPTTWVPDLLPANETSLQGVAACPAVRGATNWYSNAYSPATRLYYVMTVEDCTTYRKAADGGYGRYLDPAHPSQKIVRAFDIETGKVMWQINLPGPVQSNYSGLMSTAGGLVFFGESTGGFAAVDARTGKYLWHFETNHTFKASPMTYEVNGKQYVAIASGANIFSFALPDAP